MEELQEEVMAPRLHTASLALALENLEEDPFVPWAVAAEGSDSAKREGPETHKTWWRPRLDLRSIGDKIAAHVQTDFAQG